MGGGELRVLDPERAARGELFERARERLDRAPGPALVVGAAELRKAAGLADHETAQREQPRLHDGLELALGQCAQVRLDVAAVAQAQDVLVVRVADLVDSARDDLREQALLVGEVLVDRLLRDPGTRRDGVDVGAEIPPFQEYVRGGAENGRTFVGGPTDRNLFGSLWRRPSGFGA